jgi:hypothetical protein
MRYTSTRACVACRRQRALDIDDFQGARLAERKAATLRQKARRARIKAERLAELQPTLLELALSTLIERITTNDHHKR